MLGQGIYISAEIARLTKMHPSRVRSWFLWRSDGSGHGPLFEPDYPPADGDYAFSFLDLIDVLVAGQFRDEYNVPMKIVRKAHSVLQEQLDTKHPFCHNDLYTDGKRIFRHAAQHMGEGTLSDVVSKQQFFMHVKEALHHIDYSEASRLACRWNIARGVVVDPSVSMGKPTIRNTGVATHIITNQYYANKEDAGLVSDLYSVRSKDVMNAVNFENWYRGRRVA